MSLDDGPLGLRFKGLPPDAAELTAAELGSERRNLFTGGFSWPLMTLRQSAMEHNAALMARFATDHGVLLAPHLKTSMSPLLASFPLRHGAWGVTVATPYQARVFMAAGVSRILLANQLFEGAFVEEVSHWVAADPDREFLCLVDSVEGVRLLSRHAARPIGVLIEVGHAGGRTGVRDLESFEHVRDAALAADNVDVRGVAAYEGSVSHSRHPDELAKVQAFLRVVENRASRLPADPERELIVSAGGSIYFDCVADVLAPMRFSTPVTTIIRSGAYLTHDSGLYAGISPLGESSEQATGERLQPAIRVWAQVLSRPEPELIIVGAGRRDLNYDAGLPAPRTTRSALGEGERDALAWQTVALNDQHAFVQVPESDSVRPGDLVDFTISHPCTAHDRWTAPVVVDDDHHVVAVARSYF